MLTKSPLIVKLYGVLTPSSVPQRAAPLFRSCQPVAVATCPAQSVVLQSAAAKRSAGCCAPALTRPRPLKPPESAPGGGVGGGTYGGRMWENKQCFLEVVTEPVSVGWRRACG